MEEEIQFEKALERLEKIVAALEGGELSLDEALKRYEEGVKLSRACSKKLNETEKKIEMLTRSLNSSAEGDFETAESGLKKSTKASIIRSLLLPRWCLIKHFTRLKNITRDITACMAIIHTSAMFLNQK